MVKHYYFISFDSLVISQWMTAGKGIVHAEMPASDGDNTGLQLWINLRSNDKVCLSTIFIKCKLQCINI